MPLYAPGGTFFGTAINDGRWFESPPCRDKRCGFDGPHKHTFDPTSGREVPVPIDDTHGMRGDARDVPAVRKAG